MQNALKWSNDRFGQNIRMTLCQNISRTKCDSDKPIFSAERGGQKDQVEHKTYGF